MDRLYLMSTFLAVVDCRGLAGAARKLNLSPPRILAEVEEADAAASGARSEARAT